MSLAVSMSEGSNSNTCQEYHVSLAHTLPMEMVEAILLHLTAPDLILAAAHLPKWWRNVISASPEVWRKLARHNYDKQVNVLLKHAGYDSVSPRPVATTVLILLRSGMLFAHSGSRGKGYIFAPSSEKQLLSIVDPGTNSPWYKKPGRSGQWSIKLYDVDGGCVCNERVTDETQAYISKFMDPIKDDAPEVEQKRISPRRKEIGG